MYIEVKMTRITKANYYNPARQWEYYGYSQFKDFCGGGKDTGCEARALAKLKGEWSEEPSLAMIAGGFVDAWFEGTLEQYEDRYENLIFTKPKKGQDRGAYRAEFIKAWEAIARCKRDKLFMAFMGGKKQVIMTAEMFGVQWKIKMDSYHPDDCIVDLKYVRDLHEAIWIPDLGKVNFIEAWGYDIQGAIYQEVVRLNTGKRLPYFIAGVDKTEYPDIDIIQIPNAKLSDTLSIVEYQLNRMKRVKSGEEEPLRCGRCDYCKSTKVLTSPIPLDKFR